MHHSTSKLAAVAFACLLVAGAVAAASGPNQTVPRFVKFAGVVPGGPGGADLTFALYAEQASDAPLWTETQHVTVDESGRYAVHLAQAGPRVCPRGCSRAARRGGSASESRVRRSNRGCCSSVCHTP